MGTVWLHLWWNLKKKWSSQIRENKPNRCGFRWGWGGRMGRGIRRHELQLQALGMWKLHGDYNLQKKPIRWHHRASGRSRYPETSPRVSSDPGVLQAGCLPAQTLWKFAAWAWVPTSPDISLRPAAPPTPAFFLQNVSVFKKNSSGELNSYLLLRKSIPRQVDKKSKAPEGEKGVWDSQGGEKDRLFSAFLCLSQYNASC